jgi:CxxC motif-containing protein
VRYDPGIKNVPLIQEISGASCVRGKSYVENELKNPLRTVTSSVLVIGGSLPVTSVRLTGMVPRNRMSDVIEELKKVRLQAPVEIGQVVISNILGLGCDVIVTKRV